ncbi:MAG: hypothetical protein M3619_09140 [Myxococcota bacterium]|nr:hypothetical protein [Myxococcota bacterium]
MLWKKCVFVLLVFGACKTELSLSGLTGGGSKTTPPPGGGGQAATGGGKSGGPVTQPPVVGKLETGKAPPWCRSDYQPSTSDSNLGWTKSYMEREGYAGKTLEYMAKAACDKPRDGERQKIVAEWAAAYKASFGATDQDFVEVMTFGIMPQAEGNALEEEQCAPYKVKNEEATAEERTLRDAEAQVLGCGREPDENLLYWLDKPVITEVQRTALVNKCIYGDPAKEDKSRGEFAFCMMDMKRLDRATFDKELAGMKLNLYGKVSAVQNFQIAKAKASFLLKKYAALAEKDEEWKRLLAAPEAGWQLWVKTYEANKPAFEAIKKFDAKAAKGSKKALAGCGAELHALFHEHMSKKKAKSFEDAQKLATDMVGYPLLIALMRCDAAEARYLPVAAAQDLFMNQAKAHRGPRFESYDMTLTVLNDIRADREKFPLERTYPSPPSTGRQLWYKAYEQTFNKISYDKGVGQIKDVSKKGDMVLVTFKTVKWKEQEAYGCVNTRRIYRIRDDGTLEYEQRCKFKTVGRSSTQEPVSVPANFAKGLAPGMMVDLMIDSGRGEGKAAGKIGIPKGVYKDPDKKKFIGTFGVVW